MKTRFLMITMAVAMLGAASAQAKDVASGLPTGKRMHKPFKLSAKVVSPRDAASGLPTGKRMHKPFVELTAQAIVGPRDAASGLSTGKSMQRAARQQINRSKSNVKNNN